MPPVPVSAMWDGGTHRVTVTFNMDIQPPGGGGLDLANWVLTHDSGAATPSDATVAGREIELRFTALTGVSQIAYDPPPFDVVGINGAAAEAFVEPL